jgi:protocatechuate 3,4-dioxygenase beta subunit
MGPALGSRLVTQMFFENDPLFFQDPIFNAVPEHTRHRLVAHYDHEVTMENFALGWRWDIVLRGKTATPFEDEEGS